MMRFKLVVAASLLVLAPCLPARSQVTLDVTKITCEQFTLYKITDPKNIAIWLSGYYSGKRDKTTVDIEQLKENARKVKSYCLYNKGTVMQAVEAVVGAER